MGGPRHDEVGFLEYMPVSAFQANSVAHVPKKLSMLLSTAQARVGLDQTA